MDLDDFQFYQKRWKEGLKRARRGVKRNPKELVYDFESGRNGAWACDEFACRDLLMAIWRVVRDPSDRDEAVALVRDLIQARMAYVAELLDWEDE